MDYILFMLIIKYGLKYYFYQKLFIPQFKIHCDALRVLTDCLSQFHF